METSLFPVRVLLLTAVAPTAWGTTYIVTETFLPPDRPLFAATVRALPAGLALLAFRRQLPHGDWWWKALVLGICNIGLFFPLIFLAAYQLPGGLAATLQAMSPLAVMAIAWPTIGERPGTRRVLAALVGLVGVALLVMRTGGHVSALGLLAAIGSVLVSALGFVLVKRWPAPTDMLTVVSWQLVAGGIFLLPLGLLVEGAPPHLTGGNLLGFAWLASAGTAIAYLCWFRGLARMPAGAVALVGLINPVVGTGLGVVFAGELFGWAQALGMLLVLGGVVAGQRVVARRSGTRGSAPVAAPLPRRSTRAGAPAQAVATAPAAPLVRRTVGACVSKSPWSTLSGTCEATSSSMPTTSRPPGRCSTS